MDHPKAFGYRAVYAENTKLAGVSFDGSIGQWAVGGEVGYHMDTGLKSTGFAFAEDGARGDTWHALVNGIYLLDRGALWDTGNLVLELSYDRLDDVTENEDLFVRIDRATCTIGRGGPPGSWKDNCATKDAWGLSIRFAPQWLQVLPSLDVDAAAQLPDRPGRQLGDIGLRRQPGRDHAVARRAAGLQGHPPPDARVRRLFRQAAHGGRRGRQRQR